MRNGIPIQCLIFNIHQHIRIAFSNSILISRAGCKELVTLKALGPSNVQVSTTVTNLMITWCKPSDGRVKLNSDGASKGNQRSSGGGSILQDNGGKLIWAQTDGYGIQSNMVAETRALLQGVKRCLAEGNTHVDLEMDSFILMQIVKKEVDIPWLVIYEIRELWSCLSSMDVKIMHAYREINQAADALANIGCKAQRYVDFCYFREFPQRVKGIVNLNRMGVANLRLRKLLFCSYLIYNTEGGHCHLLIKKKLGKVLCFTYK